MGLNTHKKRVKHGQKIYKKNNITEVHCEHHVGGYRQQETWKREAGKCKHPKTMTSPQKTLQIHRGHSANITHVRTLGKKRKKETHRATALPSIHFLYLLQPHLGRPSQLLRHFNVMKLPLRLSTHDSRNNNPSTRKDTGERGTHHQ